MTGILMTQSDTFIIGQAAWLLGKVMDMIYNLLESVGIINLGVCIIILTIVIYMLLMPLTIKQAKFSKMSSAMNPEIQKIQKKYANKKDQASMQKQQDEIQLVYDKYGTSPTGGCMTMLIQMPFLFAMWSVIRNIPAYVGKVKEVYLPLVDGIMSTKGYQPVMEAIGEAQPILIDPEKYDYTQANTIIDVLYKFQASTWETLTNEFPQLEATIETTIEQINEMSMFLGMNIAEAPFTLMKDNVFGGGSLLIAFMALMVPVLAGLTQYLSIQISQASNENSNQNDQMAATMKSMNVTMPLMSVFMCFTMPTGLGIYWITSAVVRMIQQFFINRHLNKIPMDEYIKKNMEKAAKKREKRKQIEAQNVSANAHKNTKNAGSKMSEKEREEKLSAARKKNESAAAGSLASRANKVKRFNEKTNK